MSPAVVDGTSTSPGRLGTVYWPLIGSWAREPSIFRCRGFWKQLEVAMVNLAGRSLVSNFTVFQILKQKSKRTCPIHVCASFSAPTRCQNLFKVAGTHQWWRQCLILPYCSLWSTGCWTLVLWSCKNRVCSLCLTCKYCFLNAREANSPSSAVYWVLMRERESVTLLFVLT